MKKITEFFSQSFLNVTLIKKQLIGFSIALCIASLFALLMFFSPSFLEVFRLKMLDIRFRLRPSRPQLQNIVFVEMDQHAIDELGRWPWPREKFAGIISELKRQGARYILFDVLFTAPQQIVVEKEKIGGLLGLREGNQTLLHFIDQVSEALASGAIETDQVPGYLHQIKSGVGDIEGIVSANLEGTLLDNDRLLALSLEEAGNVYLGHMLEVLYLAADRERFRVFDLLFAHIRKHLREEGRIEVSQLKGDYAKEAGLFSDKELAEFIERARITVLLEDNLGLTLDEVGKRLSVASLPEMRAVYYDSLYGVIDEKIRRFLKKDREADFTSLIWDEEIVDPDLIALFRKRFDTIALTEKMCSDFGLRISGPIDRLYPALEMSPPIRLFEETMKGTGFLNAIPDVDGVVRRVPLLVRYNDVAFPQIAFSLLLEMLEVSSEDILFIPGKAIILKAGRASGEGEGNREIVIPVDENGQLFVNWAGPWRDSFTHISCADIYRLWQLRGNINKNRTLSEKELEDAGLEGRLKEDMDRLSSLSAKIEPLVKDNICIIGLTAPGTHDYNPVPLEAAYPMVGTHANILNTILKHDYIIPVDRSIQIALLFIIALFFGFVVPRVSAVKGLVFSVALGATYLYVAFDLFFSKNIWLNVIEPVSTIFLTFSGITLYNFISEEKEKRWIKSAFGHYVSKNVMEDILRNPDGLRLGGDRRILTVLFSDIRSFTTYSEKRKPEEVVSILNEYLDEMTKIIFNNNGTLDKYVGDEIMAVFGAPGRMDDATHAYLAVKTAKEMIERLAVLREKWVSEGREPLDIGVGINTGEMVVGNMGSYERMDYTVIGDAVNLGARVEALTRDYRCYIIITEFTYGYVKDRVVVKELDSVKVKGKNKPVVIYEVIDLKKEPQPC
ncbi:MAG: CHASE2 domain-containing protein [Candidatus Omnitrophica bacterium]|nr:CHASE2 domain-containing protein [Candidatus Omnitrophota bacterium]